MKARLAALIGAALLSLAPLVTAAQTLPSAPEGSILVGLMVSNGTEWQLMGMCALPASELTGGAP